MRLRRKLCGLMGLLSLLGFIGVFTDEKEFYCGMITTAIVALVSFFAAGKTGNVALLTGFAAGWAVSVAVRGLSMGYYKFRESRGLGHDKE